MKTDVLKDTNYSLHNIENYKKQLDYEVGFLANKYFELIIEYYKFIIENIKIKNKDLSKFIIIRGLNTITTVFLNLLLYTKNIDITFFHCQKSFYYYVEFIGQISEDEKMYLQLTSRDATIYVYKKSIFEITGELKKLNYQINDESREKFDIINNYVEIYKTFLYKIIYTNDDNSNDIVFLKDFEKIAEYLNSLITNKSRMAMLERIIHRLYINIYDNDEFFYIITQFVKKIIKKQDTIQKCDLKISSDEFALKINESIDKFAVWFL
jgi:hypothetical protein